MKSNFKITHTATKKLIKTKFIRMRTFKLRSGPPLAILLSTGKLAPTLNKRRSRRARHFGRAPWRNVWAPVRIFLGTPIRALRKILKAIFDPYLHKNHQILAKSLSLVQIRTKLNQNTHPGTVGAGART